MPGPRSSEFASSVTEAFNGVEPSVALLAALLSPSPFVPFEMLRSVRRFAIPAAGLESESALCSSSFVESMASDGFTLEHAAVASLRELLRDAAKNDDDPEWDELRHIQDDGLADLSPLLRLEHEIVWTYVTSDEYLERASERLLAVARAAATERRLRTLTWASSALIRLPEAVLRATGAWVLAQLCSGLGLPYPRLEPPQGELPADVLEIFDLAAWMMPFKLVGYSRNGSDIEFGIPGPRLRNAVRVPSTQPVLLWISSSALGGGPVRLVDPQGGARLPTGRSEVEIRSVHGQSTHLDIMTTSRAPEVLELDYTLDRLEDARRTRAKLAADILYMTLSRNAYILRLREEPNLTVLLPASLAGFPSPQEGMAGEFLTGTITVVIEEIERARQRVVVRRVRLPWNAGSLEVGMLVTAPVVARTKGALWLSLNRAAGVPQPENEPLLGAVRKSAVPAVHEWGQNENGERRSMQSFPVAVGDVLVVRVGLVDPPNRFVSLSLVSGTSSVQWPPPGIRAGQRRRAVVTGKEYFGVSVLILPMSGTPEQEDVIPGVIPNSELSWLGKWTYYGDATDFPLEVGDTIDVIVLELNLSLRSVYVSSKRVSRDPTSLAFSRLRLGQFVQGTLLGRQGEYWDVHLEPYEIKAQAPEAEFGGIEARSRLRINARIRELDSARKRVVLSDVSLHDSLAGGPPNS